jgi:hypothetical protein
MKHLPFSSPVHVATSRLFCIAEGEQMNAVSKLHITKDGRLKASSVKIKYVCVVRNWVINRRRARRDLRRKTAEGEKYNRVNKLLGVLRTNLFEI